VFEKKKWYALWCIYEVIVTIFLAIVGIICMVGLVMSIWSFINNQRVFSDTSAGAAIAIRSTLSSEQNTEPNSLLNDQNAIMSNGQEAEQITLTSEQDTAQIAIDHLERLHQLQRSAISHDVMAFLFSILSATLVGVCAWHTNKSKESAKKAKDSAKIAEDACLDASLKLTAIMKIMDTQIEIIHARAALFSYDQINASERIIDLPKMIKSLSPDTDRSVKEKLLQELKQLINAVNGFKDYANGLMATHSGKTTSLLQSAANYEKWIDEAIKVCENSLR
jgi:hypothetical protein